MDDAAAARVPWIGAEWDLIDLQVDQRGGRLSSSLTDGGTLRLRAGDTFRLAVLFFDGNGAALDPAPSRLRWTLRDAANLELVTAVSLDNPTAETDQAQPYFLLDPNITRLGAAAADLLPEGDVSLACVLDLDWTINGDVYSSQTLSAVVEFGLSAQTVAPAPPAPPTAPSTPTTPTPTPPTTPPPPSNDSELRALFDRWLLETLPVNEGFLYVKDGQILGAIRAGDCTTGETWTPTT